MMNNLKLTMGNIEARLFKSSNTENITQWISRNPRELILTSSTLPYPCTPEIFDNYYKNKYKTGEHEFFSIYATDKQKHIGHFEIKNISKSFGSGTIAHVILGDKHYRSKGYGKDFVRLMALVGFEYLNLYRIGLSVYTFNTNAVAAYIRGGFVFEGVIREVIQSDQQRFSLYQMSLLKPEWNKTIEDYIKLR